VRRKQREGLRNLKEAVRLFLEEAEKMGTLEQILEEAGYSKTKQKITGPKFSKRAARDSPTTAHACQSLVLFLISSW
jgi:hypothetical protein